MFLPPPLKSSAAIRAASTEPMPLVSWKMPEISLSTPTRTTSPEISACGGTHAAQDIASARPSLKFLIDSLPLDLMCCRSRALPGPKVDALIDEAKQTFDTTRQDELLA